MEKHPQEHSPAPQFPGLAVTPGNEHREIIDFRKTNIAPKVNRENASHPGNYGGAHR